MTAVISRLIIKTLCEHNGCMDFHSLQETVRSFTGGDSIPQSVLFDDSKVAIKKGKLKATAGQGISPDSLVVAKTSLRICLKKAGECQQCDSLHLCWNYVCGSCTYGKKCKNPHSLDLPYNADLVQRHDLQDLSENEIFQLLLQNDPNLLPRICKHYNMGNGLHGSCNHGASCTKLHICQHYFQGDCKSGISCTRVHNIDEQGMKVLRRLSQENIKNLREIYRNKSIIMGLQATPVPGSSDVKPADRASQQPFQKKPGLATSSAGPSKAHPAQDQRSQQDSQKPFQKKPGLATSSAGPSKAHPAQDQRSQQDSQRPFQKKPGSATSSAGPSKAHPAQDQRSQQDSQKHSNNKQGRPTTSSAGQSKPFSDIDRNEICFYFLLSKRCKFNEKCVRVHWHLPYKWEVLDSDGVTWKDLPDMEDIEKAYCDPGNEMSATSPTAPAVNFMTMTYGESSQQVRRLSTASSVSRPPNFILTTQWIWYWIDDTGKWQEYGETEGGGQFSATLENTYLADRDERVPFKVGNHQYVVRFKGEPGTPQMYQKNLIFKTKREVRRRPRFVSANDLTMRLQSASSRSTSSATADIFPPYWDKSALPEYGYRLVPLSDSMEDYKTIEELFRRTIPQNVINSIQRIQNPSLWDVFQWQKKHMKARNGGTDVNQLYLFHGTDESLVEAICEQNFDWRMCGVHGTLYGRGSYFARDASYSHNYANISKPTNKIMFVCLVLVGEYCSGDPNYTRPPPKGDGKVLYDSCVNDESDPSIYVIFEKHQIYPEYIINYS